MCVELGLCLLWPLATAGGLGATPMSRTAALIPERGEALKGGRLTGAAQVPLERADGGDTPILTFHSGRGKVRLLLDTGAASAMVSPGLVERFALGSQPLPPGTWSLAGGGADCQALRLAKTTLPELRLHSGHAPVLSLSGLETLVVPVAALPKGVDGVLGAPSLKQLPFVVDPHEGKIHFGPSAGEWRQASPTPKEVIPLVWRRGVPLAPLRLRLSAHQSTVLEALLDTGAEGLFLTRELAARLIPLGPSRSAQLVGVCGRQEVSRQRLMGLGLAMQPIGSVEAIITSNPVFALLRVQVIVGQEILRSRRQFWRLDAQPPRLELW